MKIFLQTDFQKDWAKDKEMTGIFHLFSFFLKKHETRPLCGTLPALPGIQNFQTHKDVCQIAPTLIKPT